MLIDKVLLGIFILGAIVFLVAFGSKTVVDSQIGMSPNSLELSQTDTMIGYLSIFNVFFSPVGMLVGALFLAGTIFSVFTIHSGLSARR